MAGVRTPRWAGGGSTLVVVLGARFPTRRLASVGAALLLATLDCSGGSARAGEERQAPGAGAVGDVAEQVRGWIADLASERYEVREQARQGLERWGREAPEVLRAHADDADPEVKRTLRALLARLETAVERVPATLADLTRVGLVRLEARGEPLGGLLDGLSASMGGLFQVPEEARQVAVTLALSDAPYFAAVEALAAQVGLEAPLPFDGEALLTLAAPAPGVVAAPTASVGPLRVRALRIQASRPLAGAGPATHALTLEVQLAPCVQLVSYRPPRLVSALDAQGRRWRTAGTAEPPTTYGVGGDPRRVETLVSLEPSEPEAADRLARLELAFPMRLRHERHELVFEPLEGLPRTLDEQGRASEAGKRGSVTLEAFGPAEGRNDAWTVELACVLTSVAARASVEAWLELDSGQRRRLWIAGGRSTTSADGRLRLVGRAHGVGPQRPRAVRVVWFERESEGEVALTLEDVPLR